jgi:hypothetical protein
MGGCDACRRPLALQKHDAHILSHVKIDKHVSQ